MGIMKKISRISIFGGTGYTGVELIRLLLSHPYVEIYQITSRKDKGKRVDEVYPSFRGMLNNKFVSPEDADLENVDIVFFATPNGIAMNYADNLISNGKIVIDLAADFRIKDKRVSKELLNHEQGHVYINFMQIKERTRKNKREDVYLVAEGYIEGKKVATDTVVPSYRPEKIKLWIDNEGTNLVADGSDFVTVIAAITDKYGTIKRLNNYTLKFEVEGEGELIGDDPYLSNPKAIQWGTAPILVRATTIAGEIKVKASLDFDGINRAIETELIFESIPSDKKLVFSSEELTDYKKRIILKTRKQILKIKI